MPFTHHPTRIFAITLERESLSVMNTAERGTQVTFLAPLSPYQL